MATFITSKGIGQTINVGAQTSTGYWKYNHNSTDSSVFSGFGFQTITVANANGEFTIISCLSDGTPSGNITALVLPDNQLTSFDGTGLTSLATLVLNGNQLTSLDVSPMVNLSVLYLADIYGLNGNPMTALANDAILADLVINNPVLIRGTKTFITSGGRTAAGTADYNTLIADEWNLVGLELVAPPSGGKLRIKGAFTLGGNMQL